MSSNIKGTSVTIHVGGVAQVQIHQHETVNTHFYTCVPEVSSCQETPHNNPIFSTLYKNTLGPCYFTNDKCNKHTETYIHMITWELVFQCYILFILGFGWLHSDFYQYLEGHRETNLLNDQKKVSAFQNMHPSQTLTNWDVCVLVRQWLVFVRDDLGIVREAPKQLQKKLIWEQWQEAGKTA